MKTKLLAFAGSTRRNSFNQKLLTEAVSLIDLAEAEVTVVYLADFEMPIYNEDLEASQGLPERTKALQKLMREHDGFLIASPEYNSSVSPLLKNTLDWCSRADGEEYPMLASFTGKSAGLISASPSPFGGLRGLRHLREIFGNIGMYVVPAQYHLGSCHTAFDEQGKLLDDDAKASTKKVVDQLVGIRTKIS